MMYNCV